MNALEARRHEATAEVAPALDADRWFSSLDHRAVEVGSCTCVATVLGIHASRDGLWIQLSLTDDADVGVVLHVDGGTRLTDVLRRLKDSPPVGSPLDIIDCSTRAAS